MARFVSCVWQIHPFGKGNTRTTAVFVIKALLVALGDGELSAMELTTSAIVTPPFWDKVAE